MTRYLTELSRAVKVFLQEIHCLDELLLREAEAIGKSDLEQIEILTSEKILLSQRMELLVAEIRDLELSLRQDFGEVAYDSKKSFHLSIKDLIYDIEKLLKNSEKSNEIEGLLAKLNSDVTQLISERKRIFPQVESNTYLIKKLLHYHRETYAFWQSVAGDSESTYGQTGKSKLLPQRSILSVRT